MREDIIPFSCNRRITACKDGFHLDGAYYQNKQDILYTRSHDVPDPIDDNNRLECFNDKYGNCIAHTRQRVPCFDSSDRMYDWRHWERFGYGEPTMQVSSVTELGRAGMLL